MDTVKVYESWQMIGHKKPLVGVHFEDRDKINDRDQFFAGSGNTGRNLTGKLDSCKMLHYFRR